MSTIVRATRADIDACREINKASMPETYLKQFWSNHFNQFGDLFHVAKVDGKVVGYVLCRVEVVNKVSTGLIISVAVDKEYRGKGIGEALMKEAHYTMRMRGLTLSSLQVRKSNKVAILMYEKMGYAIALSVPEYYTNPNESGWLMSLML